MAFARIYFNEIFSQSRKLHRLFKSENSGHNLKFSIIPDSLYRSVLNEHFAGLEQSEIDFFINPRRFDLIKSTLSEGRLKDLNCVLDAACGPFSFENYVQLTPTCKIEAFDFNPDVQPIYDALRSEGYLERVEFEVADIAKYQPKQRYDLLLINDLFYTNAVNFYDHIERYCEYVEEGGLVYFDLLDQKNDWVWKIFGKDDRFARYDLRKIIKTMEELGFELVEDKPSLGIKGGFDKLLRTAMLICTNATNNHIFLFRKNNA